MEWVSEKKAINLRTWIKEFESCQSDDMYKAFYAGLAKVAVAYFEGLQRYLENLEDDDYFEFVEIKDNNLEFKVGFRRVLLTYMIDKNNLCIFKTYEIAPKEDDYQRFRLVHLENADFSIGYDDKDRALTFPRAYLPKVVEQFDAF